MSTEDASPKTWLGPFRMVLLASFLLSVATYMLGYLFSLLLNPLISSGFLGTVDPFQIFSLLESVLVFVFNPIICLLIFYRIGGFSRIRAVTGYFGFLSYAFIGAAIGYAVSLAILIGIESLASGNDILGPGTDWFTFLANLTLGTARGGVDMALIAFGGVMVARLRPAPQPPATTVEEPAVPQNAEQNPV